MNADNLEMLDKVVIPLVVALIGVLATAVFAVVAAFRDRLQQAAAARRDRYADVSCTLTAWCELPYRIRRRTSDDGATLTALAERGHDLQERLAQHRAWIRTESSRSAKAFDLVLATINASVGPAMNDAWNQPPVTEPAGMNLQGWGPSGCQAQLDRFETEVQWRFGLRRLFGPVRVSYLWMRRR